MWIERDIDDALRDEVSTRPCVVVTGGRQTGKTEILVNTFPDHPYITLDLPLVADEAEQSGGTFLDKYGTPMILDEVQYAPGVFRYIKARVDRNRHVNGQYLLSGSQKFQLMKGLVESMAGRVGVVDLHSLSLNELRNCTGQKGTRAQVLDWCVLGGYPELHSKSLNPERFYGSLVVTYLERDVRSAIQVRSLLDFDRFIRLLASRSGQLISAAGLSADLGVSANTVKSWMDVLEASGIIYLLPPYHPRNFGKRVIKTPKVYFLDTGLLCFLLGIRTGKQLAESSMAGPVFETLAFGQMLRWHTNRLLKTQIYFFRDHAGHEADFVIPEIDGLRLYDAKFATKPDHHALNPAAGVLGAHENILERILITPDSGEVPLPKWGVTLRGVADPMGQAPSKKRVTTKAVGRRGR
jgi:predicted AAA+ superfamily ATPase